MSEKTRRIAAIALILLGGLFLLVGFVAAYAEDAIFDSQEFAERANEARTDDAVSTLIGQTITRQLIEEEVPELVAFRPAVEGAIAAVVGSEAFDRIFTTAVLEFHAFFFDAEGDTIIVDLADLGTVLIGTLAASNPEAAEQIPEDFRAGLLEVSERTAATETLRLAETARVIAFVLPLLALLFYAVGVAVAPSRRAAVLRVGISMAVVAALVLFGLAVGKDVFLDAFASGVEQDAAEAIFRAYLDDLASWAWILGLAGIVIAAAAASVLRPFDIRAHAHRVAGFVTYRPRSRIGIVVRALLVIGLSLFFIFEWEVALRLILSALGVYGLIWGVSEILRLTFKPADRGEDETAEERLVGKAIRGVRGSIPTLLAGAAMIAVVVLAVLALFGDGGDELLAVGPRECNGHAELCDRRVDEVAFAATHNSMSAADEGFFIPAHTVGIPKQLNSGIRGLLIDIWRGAEVEDDEVTTDLGSANRDAVAEELGEDTLAAVERLIGRPLAFEGLETDVDAQLYLCHIFCEFGATELVPALEGIKSWLEANPNEVIIIFVQDETEPTLIEEAFEDSGLAELAWQERLTPDSEFPTLGEMVRRDERLIVMAEEQATDAPWYQDGFQITQDTEFRHTSPDDMSCAFNRGLPESPLFLVNHWIATDVPDPSNAAIVNEFDFLLDRARRCEEERELTTSLLAVDFHEIGDILAVVDTLNGVSTR